MRNKSKNNILFSRLSGAGNSFFLTTSAVKSKLRRKFAKSICQGKIGLLADGAIFLKRNKKAHWAWDFYNADGSSAEMCGNAARCVFKYINTTVETSKEIFLKTKAGPVLLKTERGDLICVEMPKDKTLSTDNLIVDGVAGQFLNTGVPHFVTEAKPDENLAAKIRKNKMFGKSGTNVTFVQKTKSSKIIAITYERGVEGFTLSCGTGAVAAALFYKNKDRKSKKNFKVLMPGGELLVRWQNEDSRAELIGNASTEIISLELSGRFL